ncbi:hypothetical protein HY408_02105 [Candidatus Gottesmanbacteria bacterium]|nr:hypothetical protein [Candidatus Gottesmanbacteria bacterium]
MDPQSQAQKTEQVLEVPAFEATQPQVPPVQPQNSNTLLILIGLVLIILSGGGGFYLGRYVFPSKPSQEPTPVPSSLSSPTPTPDLYREPKGSAATANWKTYSSSTYSVKFPPDLDMKEEEGSLLSLSKWGPTQKEGTELYDGIALRFMPREIGTSLDSYVKVKIEEIKKAGISELVSGPTPIAINGYEGQTYTVKGLGTHKYTILQVKGGGLFMEITDSTVDPGNLGFSKTVDQILSTFQFTN